MLVIVFVLLGCTGAWYWLVYKPQQEASEKTRLEQIAKEEAEKQRKEQEAAQQRAAYANLIINADIEFKVENWESALSQYTEALTLFPNEQYPKDQLVLINTKLKEITALEARKTAGIVETVSSASGRFFVIVSSSIDGDLAMDYATKLAKEGNYVKIIEPDAVNLLFYRVSIGDYDTREQAESASESNGSFGDGVWVLRY